MNTAEQLRDWVRGEKFRIIAAVIAGILALFLAFQAGVAVGFHRAAFTYHLEENYGRTFGSTTGRFFMPGPGIPHGHGTAGKIVSVTPSAITIANDLHPEQEIDITDDTIIRTQTGSASSTALTTGQNVVVFGDPTDNGDINARLIRILPQ